MKNIFLLSILAISVACSSVGTSSNKLSKHNVEKTIVSGKTNKAKVIEEFGSPNMVNADSDGTEQWVYDYTRYESSGTDFGALGAAYIPGLVMVDGGMSKDVSSHKSTTLSIYFDINGIVDRYHYSTKTM